MSWHLYNPFDLIKRKIFFHFGILNKGEKGLSAKETKTDFLIFPLWENCSTLSDNTKLYLFWKVGWGWGGISKLIKENFWVREEYQKNFDFIWTRKNLGKRPKEVELLERIFRVGRESPNKVHDGRQALRLGAETPITKKICNPKTRYLHASNVNLFTIDYFFKTD